MASITRFLVGLAVVVTLLLSFSSSARVSRRHRRHNSANTPDNPNFSLKNLADASYSLLEGDGNPPPPGPAPTTVNPYEALASTVCDSTKRFRSIDGLCNNINNPLRGAAKIPLKRLSPNKYQDGIRAPRVTRFTSSSNPLPSARTVSVAVHDVTSIESDKFSHLLMNFGQFLDHDITLTPEAEEEVEGIIEECCTVPIAEYTSHHRECFKIPVVDDDIMTGTTCMPFFRSSPVPGLPGSPRERYQSNDITAYIDASQVYGSSKLKADSLRTFRGGKLNSSLGLNNEERLPLAADNPISCSADPDVECTFDAGDIRNSEQAALTSLHTLMLREHNRIATILHDAFNGDDEVIYQTVRKIVGAILQRIVYKEFLPVVLGPEIMQKYRLNLLETGRSTDYSPSVDASIVNEFSTAAFRFGHSLIKQSFSHSDTSEVDIGQMFSAYNTLNQYGSHSMLKGLSQDNMQGCDRFITTGVRDSLFGGHLDLAALNIQRGRDHGLASYNNIRQHFSLPVHKSYGDMMGPGGTHDAASTAALASVYRHTDDIELFPGGLSETPLPGAIVGPTFANIIANQFRALKQGDRFWHEGNDANVRFSRAQLREIRKATLAYLYCNNVPGAPVRQSLLHTANPDNPEVSCNQIPTLNFEAWVPN